MRRNRTNENTNVVPEVSTVQSNNNPIEYVVQENTDLAVVNGNDNNTEPDINIESFNEYYTYYNISSIENAKDLHDSIHQVIINNADELLSADKDKHKEKIEKLYTAVVYFYDKLINNINSKDEYDKYFRGCLKASQDYIKYIDDLILDKNINLETTFAFKQNSNVDIDYLANKYNSIFPMLDQDDSQNVSNIRFHDLGLGIVILSIILLGLIATVTIGGVVITIGNTFNWNAEKTNNIVGISCIGINILNILITPNVISNKLKFISNVRNRQKKYLLKYENCKHHPLKKAKLPSISTISSVLEIVLEFANKFIDTIKNARKE